MAAEGPAEGEGAEEEEATKPDRGARVFTSRPMSNDAKQWSSLCRRVKVDRGAGGNEARYVVRACATLMRYGIWRLTGVVSPPSLVIVVRERANVIVLDPMG